MISETDFDYAYDQKKQADNVYMQSPEETSAATTDLKKDFSRHTHNLPRKNRPNIGVLDGHEIVEDGIKPNKDKNEAILDLKHLENPKQLKSFLGAIQYLTKFLPRLSERTDKLRKILKKSTNWKLKTTK